MATTGPLALVVLLASGAPEARSSEVLEVAVLLLDGGRDSPLALDALIRPRRPLSALVMRQSGLAARDFDGSPTLEAVASELRAALAGRAIVAFDVEATGTLLSRLLAGGSPDASFLGVRDLLSLTHPDAPDLELESYCSALLGRPPRRRALDEALSLLGLLRAVARGAQAEEPRYRNARRALERHLPGSPWLDLLGKGLVVDDHEGQAQFVDIAPSPEAPVAFDEEAIAAVLGDEERGRRHFPRYRVRPEQIELARRFCRNLAGGGTLLLEGGTGVGKSLAYLAAAIPFAISRAAAGVRDPVVISTRTKLLQDQLLGQDIAAAACMLGHSGLRALSIKGRANYVCEKRLRDTLAEGRDARLLESDRRAFAMLFACARTRSGGEVGALPAALLRHHPTLRELVHRSVAQRAEQCSREQCGVRPECPFGRRRAALARADLIVANHHLLLRWPPDYPRFQHVIADEGHELAGVADDAYALVVSPEDVLERIDEIFGAPPPGAGLGEPGAGLLPRKQRLEVSKRVREGRRALGLDLATIGRAVAAHASEYGEVQLPADAQRLLPEVAVVADTAAARLETLARLAEELDGRAQWSFGELPETAADGATPVQKNAEGLRASAAALRQAFSQSSGDVVAAFERLVAPFDRWLLAIRAVSPAASFHDQFMQGLESFAAVSASLFVGGDALAALGELEIEERAAFDVDKVSLPSPFDYASHMRVMALRVAGGQAELVEETAAVIALLAKQLGGRTLGLFTSLRRLYAVADRLDSLLEGSNLEVLAARRASDEPAGLVRRFRASPGGGVLLGSRTFWQGVDIAGDDLQAVVIEKLPFEVPTELHRRREHRLREAGIDAFERFRLGKMLLHLKQMTGRLIRSETDRGVVVIVEGRSDRGYFEQLGKAFPEGVAIHLVERAEISSLLAEVLGEAAQAARSTTSDPKS